MLHGEDFGVSIPFWEFLNEARIGVVPVVVRPAAWRSRALRMCVFWRAGDLAAMYVNSNITKVQG